MSVSRVTPAIHSRCGALVALWVVLAVPAVSPAQPVPVAPAQLSVDEVQGSVVTLSWEPPAEVPDGYVLEGGFGPNEVLGSLAVGNGATTVSVALPPATYFIRSYAVSNGLRSAASNEVRVRVGGLDAPSAPEEFRGLAVGNGVVLTWRQTFDGGAPDQAVLEVSGPLSGSFPIEATGSFRVDGVPNGIYTLRLRAANSAGVSAATTPVTIRVPGLTAQVQQRPSLPPGNHGLPVRYEALDHPRLAELAAREGLERVVDGAATEFEAVLKLKEWVAAQFPHTNPDPYPPWDAIVILDAIRAGLTGGFCAQYSQVMLQSLAALGYPARYVEVGQTDNPFSHFPLEYWSNQFDKWVLIDVDYNLHYEKGRVPLSAREVHDALVSGQAASVDVVEGAFRLGHPSPNDWSQGTRELYYYLRYHLNANHLAAPQEAPFDRWNDMVEWTDALTVPWESSTVASPFPKGRLTNYSTGNPTLVDAPLNRIWVTPRVTGGSQLTLDLAHDMPQIARAEYRVLEGSGQAGPWRPHTSPSLTWNVEPDDRAIEVRGVNIRGVAGPATTVALVTP